MVVQFAQRLNALKAETWIVKTRLSRVFTQALAGLGCGASHLRAKRSPGAFCPAFAGMTYFGAGMACFANDNHGCDVEGYIRIMERLQSELVRI
jgi:hypothetical protein